MPSSILLARRHPVADCQENACKPGRGEKITKISFRCASTKRRPAMADEDKVQSFEEYAKAWTYRQINSLCNVRRAYEGLLREIARMADVFPDSTEITDFVCEACGEPLVHQIKIGKQGYDFFGCSGSLDGCTALYANQGGRPVRQI